MPVPAQESHLKTPSCTARIYNGVKQGKKEIAIDRRWCRGLTAQARIVKPMKKSDS